MRQHRQLVSVVFVVVVLPAAVSASHHPVDVASSIVSTSTNTSDVHEMHFNSQPNQSQSLGAATVHHRHRTLHHHVRMRKTTNVFDGSAISTAPDNKVGTAPEKDYDGDKNEDKVGIIIRFDSETGKQKVMSQTDCTVLNDLSEEQTLIARIKRKDLPMLDTISGIRYGMDYEMKVPQPDLITPAAQDEARRLKLSKLSSNSTTRRHLDEIQTSIGLSMIEADQLETGTAKETTICIADTGYSYHPDLPRYPDVSGVGLNNGAGERQRWFIGSDSTQHHPHGTILAGIIGALRDNSIGLRGVVDSTKIKLFITRALGDDSRSNQGQMLTAVSQCVHAGSDVIVVALGCLDCDFPTIDEYFKDVVQNKGKIVVAAAGNTGLGEGRYFYPASYADVISAAAVDDNGKRMGLSNANDAVELAAHGQAVYSTSIGSPPGVAAYAFMTGTSAATAYIAGTAALLWSHFPTCTNTQIRNALAKTAENPNGCDSELGHGIVKVKEAYYLLLSLGCDGGSNVLSSSETRRTCDIANSRSVSLDLVTGRVELPEDPPPPAREQVEEDYPPPPTGSRNKYEEMCKDAPRSIKVTHTDGRRWSCRKIKRSRRRMTRFQRQTIKVDWCTRSNADEFCPKFCGSITGRC